MLAGQTEHWLAAALEGNAAANPNLDRFFAANAIPYILEIS